MKKENLDQPIEPRDIDAIRDMVQNFSDTSTNISVDDVMTHLLKVLTIMNKGYFQETAKKKILGIFIHMYYAVRSAEAQITVRDQKIQYLEDRFSKIEEKLSISPQSMPIPVQLTYTTATATEKPKTRQMSDTIKPINAIFIDSKDSTPAEEVKKCLTKECTPRTEQLKIIRTTITENKKLIIQCQTPEDVTKIQQLVQENLNLQNLKPTPITRMRPRIVVLGVSEDIRKNDIISAIEEQNSIGLNSETARPIFSYKTYNGRAWVLQLEKNLCQNTLRKTRFFIGFNACQVGPYLRPTRCMKCCRLGHTQKQFPEDNRRCPRWSHRHDKDCPKGQI